MSVGQRVDQVGAMQSALADLLQRLDPQPSSRVQGLQRLSGGASQELWAFERVTGSDVVQRLILRRAPPGARLSGSGGPGLAAEAALIGKAGSAGVPVPDVIAMLQPEHGLGEGFIMQRLAGETLGRHVLLLFSSSSYYGGTLV